MIPILVRTAAGKAEEPEPERRRPGPLADRLARASLWALLVVLLTREGADDLRMLRLRARRIAGAWWADVERRSRRDVRRSQIGLVASRIGTRADQRQR